MASLKQDWERATRGSGEIEFLMFKHFDILWLIGHNVCPRWGHRRRSMPLFQPFKFRARF